jgi:FtsH-binding integral membrane protein
MGFIKVILAFGFVVLIVVGTFLGGIIGFIITVLVALVFSGMFSRIEKQKVEKQRHEEMLKAIEDNKKD